jgi:hypothetical protein
LGEIYRDYHLLNLPEHMQVWADRPDTRCYVILGPGEIFGTIDIIIGRPCLIDPCDVSGWQVIQVEHGIENNPEHIQALHGVEVCPTEFNCYFSREDWDLFTSDDSPPDSKNFKVGDKQLINRVKDDLIIYPNPVQRKAGGVNLKINRGNVSNIKVMNLLGQIIPSRIDDKKSEMSTSVVVRSSISNILIVAVRLDNGQVITKKIIVKQ